MVEHTQLAPGRISTALSIARDNYGTALLLGGTAALCFFGRHRNYDQLAVVKPQAIVAPQSERTVPDYLQCTTSTGDEVPVGTSVERPDGVDYCANITVHENKDGKTIEIFSSMKWNEAKMCLVHSVDSNKNEIVSFGSYCPSENSSE